MLWPSAEDPHAIGVLHLFNPEGARVTMVCDPAWLRMLLGAGEVVDDGLTRAWTVEDDPNRAIAAALDSGRILPGGRLGWAGEDPSDPSLIAVREAINGLGWDEAVRQYREAFE